MFMRSCCFIALFLFVSAAAFATNLSVTVTDPQSHPVPQAKVSLLASGSDRPLRINYTTAVGTVDFTDLSEGTYTLQILAAGFAPSNTLVKLPQTSSQNIALQIAGPTETVVVSATRSPAIETETG